MAEDLIRDAKICLKHGICDIEGKGESCPMYLKGECVWVQIRVNPTAVVKILAGIQDE